MDFQSLTSGWKQYPKFYDFSYNNSIQSGIWNDPLNFIKEKIQFLNDWGCRADRKTVIPAIEQCRIQFNNYIQNIRDMDLLSLTSYNQDRLKDAYELLAQVEGLGPTGISKYLHMHNRGLFIMWDNQIFRDYFHIKIVNKTSATSQRYLKFLSRMRDELLDAVNSLPLSTNISKPEAITELRSHFNNETFPRILDKYNYATRGQPKLKIK